MTSLLQLNHVSKKFGSKLAIDDLSLGIKPGEIYGFLGPNGAGKTTTIRMVMGFIKPSNGSVKLFGKEVLRDETIDFNQIGYLSADATLYPSWTSDQHLKYASQIRGSFENTANLVEKFDLDLHTKVAHLSSGNKQKLALVLALMHQPKLLILDEPTRGLDPILQNEILSLLGEFRAKGGAVFMSSHNLSEVERICDRVGIIRNGKLVTSETMQTIRKIHIHEIRAVFTKLFDPNEFKLKNIEIKKAEKKELIVHVTGDLNPIVQQISKHSVTDLEITHVSLEDMFMRFYV